MKYYGTDIGKLLREAMSKTDADTVSDSKKKQAHRFYGTFQLIYAMNPYLNWHPPITATAYPVLMMTQTKDTTKQIAKGFSIKKNYPTLVIEGRATDKILMVTFGHINDKNIPTLSRPGAPSIQFSHRKPTRDQGWQAVYPKVADATKSPDLEYSCDANSGHEHLITSTDRIIIFPITLSAASLIGDLPVKLVKGTKTRTKVVENHPETINYETATSKDYEPPDDEDSDADEDMGPALIDIKSFSSPESVTTAEEDTPFMMEEESDDEAMIAEASDE